MKIITDLENAKRERDYIVVKGSRKHGIKKGLKLHLNIYGLAWLPDGRWIKVQDFINLSGSVHIALDIDTYNKELKEVRKRLREIELILDEDK